MKRTELVLRGTEQLRATENTIASGICETADLMSMLERMRMDSKLSAVIGQEAMTELAQTLTILTGARASIIRVHGHLDDVKTRIGCGSFMQGGGEDGDKGTPPPQTGRLHVVGDNEAA
jgi:hypothetical protein